MDLFNQLELSEDTLIIAVKIILLALIAFPPKNIVSAITNHKKSVGKMAMMLLIVVLLTYFATQKLDSEIGLLVVILAIVLIKGKVITYEMMKEVEDDMEINDEKDHYTKSFRNDFYPSYVHMNDVPFEERLGKDYMPYDSCKDNVLLKK